MIKVLVAGIIEKEGKILLVQEGDEDCYGKWNLPTGHLEEHEDIFEGVKRELKEETGFDIEPIDLINIYEYFKKGDNKFRFTFTVKVIGGEEKADGKEILSLKWFDKEDIQKMNPEEFRNKHTKIMVGDYFSGKKYPKETIKILR